MNKKGKKFEVKKYRRKALHGVGHKKRNGPLLWRGQIVHTFSRHSPSPPFFFSSFPPRCVSQMSDNVLTDCSWITHMEREKQRVKPKRMGNAEIWKQAKVTSFSHNILEVQQSTLFNKIHPLTLPTTDISAIRLFVHQKSSNYTQSQSVDVFFWT